MLLRVALGAAVLTLSFATTAMACEYMAEKAGRNQHKLVQQEAFSPVIADVVTTPPINSSPEAVANKASTATENQRGLPLRVAGDAACNPKLAICEN